MSFASPPANRVRSAPVLPIASMIDILFLLLIFFLTTSALRDHERQMNVTLPATENSQTSPVRGTQTVITVLPDGRVYIGQSEHSLDSLKQTLQRLAAQYPDEEVLVRGDRDSRWGTVVRVMDIAYAAGLRNVYAATTRLRGEVGADVPRP